MLRRAELSSSLCSLKSVSVKSSFSGGVRMWLGENHSFFLSWKAGRIERSYCLKSKTSDSQWSSIEFCKHSSLFSRKPSSSKELFNERKKKGSKKRGSRRFSFDPQSARFLSPAVLPLVAQKGRRRICFCSFLFSESSCLSFSSRFFLFFFLSVIRPVSVSASTDNSALSMYALLPHDSFLLFSS